MARWAEVRRAASKSYWREADARVVVEAWRESGEPMARFALRHGVDRQRLARWSARLGGGAPRTVRFHPVRLTSEVGGGERAGGGIEIEAGGRRIRVGHGFDAQDLRRVLAVLEEGVSC